MEMEGLEELRWFLNELEQVAFQLFQSGFASVHDSTLKELKKFSGEANDYGLFYAADILQKLSETLENSKHQFASDYTSAVVWFANLERYLSLCSRRVELMQVKVSMSSACEAASE